MSTIHLQPTARKLIKTKTLVKRAHKIAMGEEKASTQSCRMIEVLLRKSLPDYSAVQVQDGEGNALPINFQINLG